MKTIDHRFAWISPELGAVWRLEPRAVVGVRDDEVFPVTAVEGHRHQDRMVIEHRQPYAIEETDMAGDRWFETVKVPLVGTRRAVVGTFGCCYEVPAGGDPERGAPDARSDLEWMGFSHVGLRPPLWLRRLRRSLHSSFRQRVDIRDLLAAVDVSLDHATRMFRRFYGSTPAAYRRHHRILWGWQRLLETEETAGRIALAAGFSDQSHFTRDFKREWGLPPGRARASDRAG